MLNKNLLDEEVNKQMACIFMNILWIIPLSVRKGFYMEKKLQVNQKSFETCKERV